MSARWVDNDGVSVELLVYARPKVGPSGLFSAGSLAPSPLSATPSRPSQQAVQFTSSVFDEHFYPTYQASAKSRLTGNVSVSTLLSPPPVGPVCGRRFGQTVRSQNRRANCSNAVSLLRLVKVERWYSRFALSSLGFEHAVEQVLDSLARSAPEFVSVVRGQGGPRDEENS